MLLYAGGMFVSHCCRIFSLRRLLAAVEVTFHIIAAQASSSVQFKVQRDDGVRKCKPCLFEFTHLYDTR